MQRQGDFDHAEIAGQVAAVGVDRFNDDLANLVGQTVELRVRHCTQIRWIRNPIEYAVHHAPPLQTPEPWALIDSAR